jgi:hypothetical protein
MGVEKRGPYLGWLGGRGSRGVRDANGLRPVDPEHPFPSEFLAEALDDTFPRKTSEHWLWLRVWNLSARIRALRGLPAAEPPRSCYAQGIMNHGELK